MLSCNGTKVGDLAGTGGFFRLFNNTVENDANTDGDHVDTGDSDGEEVDDLTTTNNTGGQDPAEGLGAIGLVFSYFMGTDGTEYDQVTAIQSIDVADDPGSD